MKVVVLTSHTPSLLWFRMDMIQSFLKKGCEVVAFGPEPEAKWAELFRKQKIRYRTYSVSRNGINPFKDIRTYRELCRFLKEEKPDKIFAYQAKSVIYGSLAAKRNHIDEVYLLIAGLGSVFIGRGFKNSMIRLVMKIQYYIAFRFSKKVFFQNRDDRAVFVKSGLLDPANIVMLHGSGVNTEHFMPVPLPETQGFLYIGRLIRDKGVVEYLEACSRIKKKYPHVRCLLVGPYDSNPSALKPEELKPYLEDGIEYFGEQTDVRPFIAMCSVFVLPSYHEGTPKTVLESMAMGRAVLTTNAPGCRETVMDGRNGYLVPVKDIDALTEKMEYLLLNWQEIGRMGRESLSLAREKYDVRLVNKVICDTMGLK